MTEKVPKKLEDLTLDEIKAQLAIYHNLYQKRRKKEDPVYLEKERERGRQKYYRKKEREQANNPKPEPKVGNRKYNYSDVILVDVVK